MKKHPKILDIITHSDDPAADHAMAAGLAVVDEKLQCRLIDILVTRGREFGLQALPEVFDRISPAAQDRVIAHTAHLFGALRVTVRDPVIQTRLNSLNIIRRSRNPRLAYLAGACVLDGSHQIRMEAAQTLLELTELHCANHADITAMLQDAASDDNHLQQPIAQTLRLLREERQHLVAAVRDALTHFDNHHRPEVLEAAMCISEELESALLSGDTIKRGKLTQAILDVYGQSPSPRLAAFTYIALKYPELRRRVVTVLSGLKNPAFFIEFIRFHWLARDPDIRRNLSALRTLNWLGDGFEAVFVLPPHIAAQTPAWLLNLGLTSDQKVRLLMNFLLSDNPDIYRAAMWALIQIHTPAANLALQGALDHEDRSIRTIADLECRHRRRLDDRQVRTTRNNRPNDWSELLDRAGLAESFEDFWLNFDRIPAALAKSSGHLAVKYIPSFLSQMQMRLVGTHPADRLRALKMLHDLNLADRFCKEIFALANDGVSEVRAAALRPLGVIGDATSRRILERALADSSPDVQAAAIESLDRMSSPRRAELFLPKTTSDDSVVRASAVMALLKMHQPKAAVALIAMLKDSRAEHRCSALWIIEQLRLSTLAPRVEELAKGDPDPRIGRIAEQVLRRLERIRTTTHVAPLNPRHAAQTPMPVAVAATGGETP